MQNWLAQVAMDVGVEMTELPEQRTLDLGTARVEFPHFGVEQVVEEQARILTILNS